MAWSVMHGIQVQVETINKVCCIDFDNLLVHSILRMHKFDSRLIK